MTSRLVSPPPVHTRCCCRPAKPDSPRLPLGRAQRSQIPKSLKLLTGYSDRDVGRDVNAGNCTRLAHKIRTREHSKVHRTDRAVFSI